MSRIIFFTWKTYFLLYFWLKCNHVRSKFIYEHFFSRSRYLFFIRHFQNLLMQWHILFSNMWSLFYAEECQALDICISSPVFQIVYVINTKYIFLLLIGPDELIDHTRIKRLLQNIKMIILPTWKVKNDV